MAQDLMGLLGLGGGLPARPNMGTGGLTPALMQIMANMTGPSIAPPRENIPGMNVVGTPLDAQIQSHIANSPVEPFEPAAVPNAPKNWQRILAALGDAMTVYGSGLGAPVPIGNATGNLMGIDQARGDAMRYNAEGAKRVTHSKNVKDWEAKLQLLLEQQKAETAAAAEKKAKEDAALGLKEKRTYDAEQAAIKRQQDLDDAEAKRKFDERVKAADRAHDYNLDRLRRGSETSKETKDQLDKLGEAKAIANQVANNLQKIRSGFEAPDKNGNMISYPPRSLEEIRTRYRRDIEELNLGPEAKAAAMAYFEREIAEPDYMSSVGAREIK